MAASSVHAPPCTLYSIARYRGGGCAFRLSALAGGSGWVRLFHTVGTVRRLSPGLVKLRHLERARSRSFDTTAMLDHIGPSRLPSVATRRPVRLPHAPAMCRPPRPSRSDNTSGISDRYAQNTLTAPARN
eukprot:3234567-Prymnesium_polylepis.1